MNVYRELHGENKITVLVVAANGSTGDVAVSRRARVELKSILAEQHEQTGRRYQFRQTAKLDAPMGPDHTGTRFVFELRRV